MSLSSGSVISLGMRLALADFQGTDDQRGPGIVNLARILMCKQSFGWRQRWCASTAYTSLALSCESKDVASGCRCRGCCCCFLLCHYTPKSGSHGQPCVVGPSVIIRPLRSSTFNIAAIPFRACLVLHRTLHLLMSIIAGTPTAASLASSTFHQRFLPTRPAPQPPSAQSPSITS